jgi:HPt (histidine-containing phosphotransfer) domain-containing protein
MTDFEVKMQQLREEYRGIVDADIRHLQQVAADLGGDERDRAILQDMIEILHRMAGGAGVFGYEQLSEQARALELALIDCLAEPLSINYREGLPQVRATLADLALSCD